MGRAPCCDKTKVKRGPWSLEEDNILKNFLEKNGIGGNWIALPQKAGLRRCGKSCRLRWLNYLRPDIKHGGFTEEEDNIILTLYNQIGSRWSVIAANLQGRTDNDVKNHWNTKLKKKLLASQNISLIITKENNIISSVFKHNYSRNYYGILDNYSNTFTSHLDTNLTNYSSCDQFPLPPLMEIQENDATIQVEDGYNVSSLDDSLKMLSHRSGWNPQRCGAFKGSNTIQSDQVEDGYNLCSLDDDPSKMLSRRPGWNRQKCVTFKGSDTIQSVQVEDGYNLCSLDNNSSKMLSNHPCWNRLNCTTFEGSDEIQSVQVEDGYNLCSLDDDSSKMLSHPCWIRQECTILERYDTRPSTFLKNSSSISYDLSFGISSSTSSSSYYGDILENGFDFQENAMGVDDPNSSHYNNVLEIDQIFKGFEN